jgi:hypothetical protein
VVVKAVFKYLGISATAFATAACGETVTHRENIPTSFGDVRLVITSVGGALGEERYELLYQKGEAKEVFFRGINFAEFKVEQRGKKIRIQLCRGSIEKADPVYLNGNLTSPPVRLDIDWNCQDKTREN